MMEKRWFETVKNTEAGSGELLLWRVGQAGFLVKLGEKLLCLDLYLTDNPERTSSSIVKGWEIDCADLVFGSHDHPDHIDREAWTELLEKSPYAEVLVPELIRSALCKDLGLEEKRVVGLRDMETVQVGNLKLTGVASAHERLDRDPLTGNYPYMGVVIEAEGFSIYHPGDTCLYEGLYEKVRSFGTIDVMLLPINGRDGTRYRQGILGNMTYQEAVDFAGALRPRLAVPTHYDMFRGNLEDPQKFVDYVKAKYPEQDFWVGKIGELLVYRTGR